jgi:hypothetical protein
MILDACCGSLKIYNGWFGNLGEEFITVDKRHGDFSFKKEGNWGKSEVIVKPTVCADVRYLPFKDGVFNGIVCDPPHLECSATSNLGIYYGSWSETDTIRHLRLMDPEFDRVLTQSGFLFLKIMADRKNIYLTLLKHFNFFLPIQLKRPRGCFGRNKGEVDGALWMIANKRLAPKETVWEVIPPEEIVNPFMVFNSEKVEKNEISGI